MNTKTEQILTLLKVMAWIVFFGYIIKAGAILISFIVSQFNPVAAQDLYKGLSFNNLYEYSLFHYSVTVAFIIAVLVMKSIIWWRVIKTFLSIDLNNPFIKKVSRGLEKISLLLFVVWLMGTTISAYIGWMQEKTGESYGNWETGEYLFMAGLVFIISQVFKRGMELQSENELTV